MIVPDRRGAARRTGVARACWSIAVAACLLAGCGNGDIDLSKGRNIDLGGGSSSGGSTGSAGSATGGTSPTTPATPAGSTVGGSFSFVDPSSAATTQVNVLSGSTVQSVSNGSDFSFVALMPATAILTNQRSLSECFSSSAAAPWVFLSASQANSQTVVVDQNASAAWAAGASCQSCIEAAFTNQSGVAVVNLPAGNFCIGGWNTGALVNSLAAKLRPLADYNWPSYVYNGVALNVVFALAPMTSTSWAFSLRSGTHMILEGGNSGGGLTYLVSPSGITAFQQSNGGLSGGFTYLTQADGTSICGTGPASTDSTPNNCDNLDQMLVAGTYYYGIVNPTNGTVSFNAFALEYVPQ